MDCNENLETSLDDIFNFNVYTQGGNKKKRSSILKQTKKANVDIYENEETDSRRSRLSTKRVSFAEKFQVKELHTGNIYDIPGWNESSQRSHASIQLSYVAESEANDFVGSFSSRSLVPDALVTFQEPTGSSSNRNQITQNIKPQAGGEGSYKNDRSGFTFKPPNAETHFEKENLAPSTTSQTVLALLEGKPVIEEKEIMQYRDNGSVYAEPYGRKEEYMDITSTMTHSPCMGEDYLKEKNIFEDFDFLRDPLLKSSSQELKNGKENPSWLQDGNESEIVGLGGRMPQRSAKGEVNVLNKENVFPTSPRFKNLKFIDSPPSSWKSDPQKVLNHQGNALSENKLVGNTVGGVAFLCKSKFPESRENVLAQNQQKSLSLPSEADKENVYYNTVQRAICEPPVSKFVSRVPILSLCEEDDLPMNKTRCSVSPMDLTCLPEAFNEDADASCGPELDTPVDQELSFEGIRLFNRSAIEKRGCVNEKTHNKTRLSTCDMEFTCAFNYPMDDSSLSVSPPRDEKLDDVRESAALVKNNLNHFKEIDCALDLSPKSSQQSNFSFEEIEQNPALSNSMIPVGTRPVSDIDELVNISKPNKCFESTLMNPSCGNKEYSSDAGITSSEIPENKMLKKTKQNLNIYNAADVAPDQKYLKFSTGPENAPDRLQTQSESEASFALNNKENLNTDRKRAMDSTTKPTRRPLGFRTDDLEVNFQSKPFGKSLAKSIVSSEESALVEEVISAENPCRPETLGNSQMTRLFRSEVMELTCHNFRPEENEKIPTPVLKQVHILTETEISSPNVVISSRKYENTRYSTNYMDLTCLPESEDSSNVLDSFQEAGTKIPSFVSDEIELFCNLKNQSKSDTNYSMNSSAFRRIEQLSETVASINDQTGNYSHWPLKPLNFGSSNNMTNLKNDKNTQYFTSEAMELTCKTTDFQRDRCIEEDSNNDVKESNQIVLHSNCLGDKTLAQYESKTQYFASQPMEITCKTVNFQDGNMLAATAKYDNSVREEHHVTPYFHLKELPVPDSTDKKSLNCSSNRNVRARQKLFKVVTDDSSSSKPTKKSNDKRAKIPNVLPSNPLGKNSLNEEIISSESEMDSRFRVNATHEIIQKISEEIVSEQPCPKVADKDSDSADLNMIKTRQPTRTPGAVYKIRKIKQAFKETSNNLVLFPKLSEVLRKKQKFNFKHPYSEMKITSPGIKDCRQNRSFDPSSQENSFSCSSTEGSRLPSLGQLSQMSCLKEASKDAEMPVVQVSAEVKNLCQEIENLNVLVTSSQSQNISKVLQSETSEKKQSPNASKGDCSTWSPEKLRGLNVLKADHSVLYSQVPSIMYDDDSLQLLQHSALENTFLEAASKNYTICLDRSDFVLKEKCPVSIDEQPQLLPPNLSLQNENESALECNDPMSQTNSNAQVGAMSPEKSKVDDKPTSIVDEALCGRKRPLTFSEINKSNLTKETHSPAMDVPQHETSTNNSLAASRLKEKDYLFSMTSLPCNDALKSSPMKKTRRLYSPEKNKSSMDMSLTQTDETCPAVPPSHTSGIDKTFNIQDVDRIIGEIAAPVSDNVEEPFKVQEDLKIVSDVNKTLSTSTDVEKTLSAHKIKNSFNIQDVENDEMDVDSQAGVPSTEKEIHFASNSGISETSSIASVRNSSGYPDGKCDNSSQVLVKDRPNDLISAVNKEVIRNHVVEPEECIKSSVGNSSDCRVPVLPNNLNKFEEQCSKAFASDGHKLKLKNLCESAATFELTWAVGVYKCVLRVDVKRISASESSISFTPVGENAVNSEVDDVFDDIEERGYKFFQYLVTDTLLPFPVFGKELIEKLTQYSKVANDVETLMRDLLKVSLTGICVIPHDLEPLELTIEVINTNYECICNMTFYVDLKKYPREKIIPEVKHVLCGNRNRKNITKEVQIAAASVEPGRNYLYRMVDAALELKP